jgi:hypothetical protein
MRILRRCQQKCVRYTHCMALTDHLAMLFARDLGRLYQQIEAFPDDESLWKTLPGITNSAGNLALHLEGNLREYIGRQLGHVSYQRERPLEFGTKGIGRAELAVRITDLKDMIPAVVGALSFEELAAQYPEVVLEKALSTEAFLIHLYGHLNWHLGQIDYVRRIVTGHGAVRAVGL